MSASHVQPTPQPAPSSVESVATMDELPGSPLAPRSPSPSDPLLGTLVDGRYQVIAPIAEGGMGRVYRAHHRTANRTVALKVLTGDCDPVHKEVREARFIREARVISGLAHPNVVQVYDFGVLPNGELYYVMEFIAGEPLADLVYDYAPMPVERITRLALQMAAGLRAAHEQGIVHRDLKPENVIIIEQNGEQVAKVVDFGIAKILGDTGKKLTRTGIVTGTPHYISPEQARAAELDTRSDVYSFGVMLYEMAVGQLPFDEGESWVALLEAHIRQPPPTPSSRGIELGALEGIILRCLAKDPAQRFQSMADLMAVLERPETAPQYTPQPYVADPAAPPHARPSSLPASPMPAKATTPAIVPTRAAPKVLGALAALALVLGASAFFVTAQLDSDEPVPVVGSPPAQRVTSPASEPEPQPLPETPEPPGPATHLVSEPPGAEVMVDGVVIGNTPIDVPLPTEGPQVLQLTLPDHFPIERTIDGDAPADWALTLRRRPAPRRVAAPEVPAEAAPEPAPEPSASVTDNPRIRIEEPINPWAD